MQTSTSDIVEIKVRRGWVTLTGDVGFRFQSDAAYDDVASPYGVVGVTNEIKVTNRSARGRLAHRARVEPRRSRCRLACR